MQAAESKVVASASRTIKGITLKLTLATGQDRAIDRIPGAGGPQCVTTYRNGIQAGAKYFATAAEATAEYDKMVAQLQAL